MVDEQTHPKQTVTSRHDNTRRGGMQCLRHILAGWPAGQDCPCVTKEGQRG